eukprot:TRINITY_DN14470_c0_g3_i6.p1 TRINITY_DN14470_c0_g3~~TRINITY_DN14470_c0_g3_i6.p1  ORF type:complete len:417 (+),score=60.94 TRINITY_DN14470_c0_g3_i6:81-1253(+)
MDGRAMNMGAKVGAVLLSINGDRALSTLTCEQVYARLVAPCIVELEQDPPMSPSSPNCKEIRLTRKKDIRPGVPGWQRAWREKEGDNVILAEEVVFKGGAPLFLSAWSDEHMPMQPNSPAGNRPPSPSLYELRHKEASRIVGQAVQHASANIRTDALGFQAFVHPRGSRARSTSPYCGLDQACGNGEFCFAESFHESSSSTRRPVGLFVGQPPAKLSPRSMQQDLKGFMNEVPSAVKQRDTPGWAQLNSFHGNHSPRHSPRRGRDSERQKDRRSSRSPLRWVVENPIMSAIIDSVGCREEPEEADVEDMTPPGPAQTLELQFRDSSAKPDFHRGDNLDVIDKDHASTRALVVQTQARPGFEARPERFSLPAQGLSASTGSSPTSSHHKWI